MSLANSSSIELGWNSSTYEEVEEWKSEGLGPLYRCLPVGSNSDCSVQYLSPVFPDYKTTFLESTPSIFTPHEISELSFVSTLGTTPDTEDHSTARVNMELWEGAGGHGGIETYLKSQERNYLGRYLDGNTYMNR